MLPAGLGQARKDKQNCPAQQTRGSHLQALAQVNHVDKLDTAFEYGVVVVFREEPLDHMRALEAASLVKRHGERTVTCPHLQDVILARMVLGYEVDEHAAIALVLAGGIDRDVRDLQRAIACICLLYTSNRAIRAGGDTRDPHSRDGTR